MAPAAAHVRACVQGPPAEPCVSDAPAQLRNLYIGQLALGAACVAGQAAMAVWLADAVRRCAQQARVWTCRQRYFTRAAQWVLMLGSVYAAAYVATLALQVAQTDCSYAWPVLEALEFIRVGGCYPAMCAGCLLPPRCRSAAQLTCCPVPLLRVQKVFFAGLIMVVLSGGCRATLQGMATAPLLQPALPAIHP